MHTCILFIIFIIHQKVLKNAHYNFPKPNLTYSKVLFCPTQSPKPKGMKDENQQIFTFEKLHAKMLCLFFKLLIEIK